MLSFIKNLFAKKENIGVPAGKDVQTAPLAPVIVSSPIERKRPLAFYPSQMIVGTAQSVGRLRDHNEDALFSINAIGAAGSQETPFCLLIVADGMGGYQYGELASESAMKTAAEHLLKHIFPVVMGLQPSTSNDSLQEVMGQAVRAANQVVMKTAPGGGTTLTIALIIGEKVTMAHVGDSRGYFIFEDGSCQVLTQDHSLVGRLIELGQLSKEQAKVFPQKNVLYRALGQPEPFKADIQTHEMPAGGWIMLCSDGLWGSVSDEDMIEIIRSNPDPGIACHKLVEAANNAGGPDNISVVLARYLS